MKREILAALAVTTAACAAHATNLVRNGGFEITTNGPGEIVTGGVTGARITSATDWYAATVPSNHGYPFLFVASDQTETTGFPDAKDAATEYLWGPKWGANNGFTGASPDGGNFLIADGAYNPATIYQNLSGLKVGDTYTLTFDWAAGQWHPNSGDTTERFQVGINGQTFTTSKVHLTSHGFSGWRPASFTFKYNGKTGSDILSFLAVGTPNGDPPMLLLDGVSINVPEPSTWALMILGVGGLGLASRRRRRELATA